MRPKPPAAGRRGREGIALVIVLGFLAILTILAVSFAISMRVERLSANIHLHTVRARHFAQVGLARACESVNSNLSAGSLIYPTSVVFVSTSSLTNGPQPGLVDTNEETQASRYLPDSVFPTETEARSVRWVNVTDPASTNVIGRFAWIGVNCSGLLDANTVATMAARARGSNTGEIRITNGLPPDVTNALTFTSTRGIWARIESVAELRNLSGVALPPRTLFPYSRCPAGYRTSAGAAAPVLDLAGTNVTVATVQAQLAGIGSVDAAAFAQNVVDYIDPDFRPQDPYSFPTEATPLINEVIVTNSVTADAAGYVYRANVSVELWFPFANTNTLGYTVRIVAPTFTGLPSGLTPPAALVSLPASGPWTRDRYGVYPGPVWASPGQSNWPSVAGARLNIQAVELREGSDAGPLVDVVTGLVFAVGTALAAQTPPIPPFQPFAIGKSADDPRLNWDGGSAAQWRDPTTPLLTPGGLNPSFTRATGDVSTLMYVANRAPEVSGELGFLLYTNRPWRTVPLLGPDAIPVLDRFFVNTNRWRGFVNPNAPDAQVLQCVFLDLPIERYPGEPSAPTCSTTQALALANSVVAARIFTNRSDLGRVTLPSDPTWNGDPWRMKALIRNAADLLGTRQNLFTFLVAGQSVADGDKNGTITDDEVIAEARAVAVWWRDPYGRTGTNAVPANPSFVRFFKWVDE